MHEAVRRWPGFLYRWIRGEAQVPQLASVVADLLRASQNRDVGVMVGGPILLLRPELLATVGADFTAADARIAVETAESFVAARAPRHG